MRFEALELDGAYRVELDRLEDDRGFFARSWCRREFEEAGLNADVVQTNVSYNKRRGTIRGMHYQAPPDEESKLVRCTAGAIFDVIIDLRPGSPTFERWLGLELNADNRSLLYVPEGCAHGFQVLDDDSEVTYQVTAYYAPSSEGGVRWNDPYFAIEWPIAEAGAMTISDKDDAWADYIPGSGM